VRFGPETTGGGPRPPGGEHPLGTDAYGRDLLSRIAWGARTSLTVGFAAMALHVLVGGVVGGLAGTLRGPAGGALRALIDGMQCFPTLFLALALMAFVRPGMLVVIAVIGLTGWPATARLVRAEALRVARSDFVQAARVLGAGPLGVVARHVAPQVAHQVLVAAAFGVGSAILYESTLGFLGLGVPPPEPSLGDLLRGARERLASAWWLAVFPGLFLAALLLSCQQVAEALRARAGPRPTGGGA
jgi:peptide/nickel transport system permease protein